MEVALPKYVAFKTYFSRYLEYHHEGPIKGCLKYSSENLVSIYTKFEIEPAKAGGGLVNIRCCYNNKYWASSNDDLRLVTPFVAKPQEDKNTWPCTLFRVSETEVKGIYTIYDVRFKSYAALYIELTSLKHTNCLTTYPGSPGETHHIIDFESLLVLPKHVVFKGDNEKYLQLACYNGDSCLEFSSDDIGHPNVSNEVFTMNDGSIRLKSEATKKFWIRESSNWIQPHSGDVTGDNINTRFWPTKISKNVMALRSLGNNNYCKRLTADNKISCLNASLNSITKEAHFVIEEPVISRKIYNVSFRTMDAMIHNEKILTMATADTFNSGTEPVNVALQLKYTETKSQTWESSLTMSVGLSVSIQAGIPLIGETSISINATFTGSYSWGETLTKSEDMVATYTVNVPPKTRLKVSLVATNGTCEIPFSYTKRDILKTGQQVITLCDDGIYYGVNSYKFDYKTESIPM